MGKNCDPVKNLVSIVTPVYNGEAHLARFLDSVLVQSWDHIEMILTDDGSEDGTLEAAEAYRNAFARRGFGYQIVTGRHRNASAAINRGLLQVRTATMYWSRILFAGGWNFCKEIRSTSVSALLADMSMRPESLPGQMRNRGIWKRSTCFFRFWKAGLSSAVAAICCGQSLFSRSIRNGRFRNMMWGRIFRCFCHFCIHTAARLLQKSSIRCTSGRGAIQGVC